MAPRTFDLSVESYGSLGRVDDWLPRGEPVHLFFGGGDIQLRDNLVVNLGVELGATSVGEQTMLKMPVGWMF